MDKKLLQIWPELVLGGGRGGQVRVSLLLAALPSLT
mgnify:CR=1 FL=1